MASGNNKVLLAVLSAVLALMTIIIVGSFNYIIDDLKETMIENTIAIEALTKATNLGLLDRELTKKDVVQIRKDLDRLIERNGP